MTSEISTKLSILNAEYRFRKLSSLLNISTFLDMSSQSLTEFMLIWIPWRKSTFGFQIFLINPNMSQLNVVWLIKYAFLMLDNKCDQGFPTDLEDWTYLQMRPDFGDLREYIN